MGTLWHGECMRSTECLLVPTVILFLIILSNSFPKLHASLIPLSFEHLHLTHFPLYSLVISPICHWSGIVYVWISLLISFRYISRVWWLACVNISFGNLSGPGALLFFSCFIGLLSSCIVAFSGFMKFLLWVFSSLTLFVMLSVQFWYSGFPIHCYV